MIKSKIIILLLLSFISTPKSILSQICLENQSNGKIIELDTSRILTLYSGNNFVYVGKIISFNDTVFVMESTVKVDSNNQTYNYILDYTEIEKIQYWKLKNRNKYKKRKIPGTVISTVAAMVSLGLISRKMADNPAYILVPITVFLSPMIINDLTTKVYRTKKKWKIVVCS